MSFLNSSLASGAAGLGATLVFWSLIAAPAGAQVIDPTSCDLVLDPGVLQDVLLDVCVPGVEVSKADIVLLADNTASMGDVITSIQAGAAVLTDTLLNEPNVDIQIGVAKYTDVPPFIPDPFILQQPITSDENAIIAAINSWGFAGGGDVSESQFLAMHRINVDPALGFRPDAKRIIVWFGDSPAHDPICGPILQIFGEPPVDLTEASLTAELLASGPFGGTTVIAISTPFSTLVPDALNNDPLGPGGIFAEDYINLGCAQNGLAGQADRLASATQGIATSIPDPQAIVDAILAAIESILTEVSVSLAPFGEIAPFITGIDPPEITVELPNDVTQEVCVQFTVSFEGQGCVENTAFFEGGIDVLINGNPVATKPVTIEQPGCKASQCLMFVGFEDTSVIIPGGTAPDMLYVVPAAAWPVLIDSVPSFHIPSDPVLDGVSIYLQVGMLNGIDFPDDPVKTSNGLRVVLGRTSVPYGISSGMQMYLEQPPLLGGVLDPAFTIDGL